jgi:hypothetical protein
MPLRKYAPDERLASIHEIDLESLRFKGIEGLIFDLDNTIGTWGFRQIDEQMLTHIQDLHNNGFKLAFLSNDHGKDREYVTESLAQFPLIYAARKPELAGYRAILAQMNLPPSNVAMIGDQLFTDVFGAKRMGMYAIMVKPVSPEVENWEVGIRRFFERVFFFFWS